MSTEDEDAEHLRQAGVLQVKEALLTFLQI